jgi:hypothetical protein
MDVNVLAYKIVQQATGETTPEKKKQLSSRLGGQKGGVARARLLSSARKQEIARKANAARWNKTGLSDPEKID